MTTPTAPDSKLVLIRGGGDLGSGVAVALVRAGHRVVVQDLPRPTALRLTVAFAAASLEGSLEVGGVTGRHLEDLAALEEVLERGEVAVWTGEEEALRASCTVEALVDARLQGLRNPSVDRDQAPRVIALGPGYVAGEHAHFVIETNRGPDLGRVLTSGTPSAHTGIPGEVEGHTEKRLLRAPADGTVERVLAIGDPVEAGEVVARVGGEAVRARLSGMVRGLKLDGVPVRAGHKIGDVDPRRDPSLLHHPSDKASRIGAAVLEALAAPLPSSDEPPENPSRATDPRSRPMSTPAETLDQLARDYWSSRLRANPLQATSLGIPGHDDRLPDQSPESLTKQCEEWREFHEAASEIPREELSPEDALTRDELLILLERQGDGYSCHLERHLLSPLTGPHVRLLRLPQVQPLRTTGDCKAYLARLAAAGPFLNQHLGNLQAGMRLDEVTSRMPLIRVSRQLTRLLETPTEEWTLARHAAEFSTQDGKRARELLDVGARPALARLTAFLLGELLPQARSDEEPGLCHLPDGEESYARCIHVHTSLRKGAQEIHDRGLQEVARLHSLLLPLAEKTLGIRTLSSLRETLDGNLDLHFGDPQEIVEKARAAVERADARLGEITNLRPKAPCRVLPIPPMEAPDAPLAYYRAPAVDGSRPGTYYVNTHAPETKLTIDAEGIAFHEAVPGHHLQIAIAQTLDLPDFRRHGSLAAYAEGWALYTEKLSDEIGLYSSDLDRLGMYAQDLWRAARLVLDTGLHALGWSRDAAIDFAMRQTLLPHEMIVNEVDRFVVMPGQALSYKIGEFEILRLRKEQEEKLGADFDRTAFHDTVLGSGSVSLGTLEGLFA